MRAYPIGTNIGLVLGESSIVRSVAPGFAPNPIIMALAYMLYFWAAAWFIGWAALEHVWWPLIALIPVWLILDFLNIQLMPLSVMRKKG